MHLKLWVISNLLHQNCTPYFFPIPGWIFSVLSGMEGPWKVILPQSKHSPKLLLLFPYSKGKVEVWGTLNHPKWDFGVKNSRNQFLTLKQKIDPVLKMAVIFAIIVKKLNSL